MQLHGRDAEHLERQHAGNLLLLAAELAHHFELAERDAPAARHLADDAQAEACMQHALQRAGTAGDACAQDKGARGRGKP